jgi:transglutaminase-like putative cysteine protease
VKEMSEKDFRSRVQAAAVTSVAQTAQAELAFYTDSEEEECEAKLRAHNDPKVDEDARYRVPSPKPPQAPREHRLDLAEALLISKCLPLASSRPAAPGPRSVSQPVSSATTAEHPTDLCD